MKYKNPLHAIGRTAALVIAVVLGSPNLAVQADRPPNFVLIMADDLGFSDLGCYGGEIATPNLDRLAQNGLRFAQFYNTGRCWPTRGALLTGYYAQAIRRDQVPGIRSGGRGKRPDWAPLLPRWLRPAGYRCYHSGKWHIDGMPCAEGFDRSYYLRDQHRFFSPRVHYLDDRKLPPVAPDSGFYATTAIADRAIAFLQDHAAKDAARPFFLYVAFTAPHFPLQARADDISRYQGRYDAGWETLRKQRWDRIEEMGFVRGRLSQVEPKVGPPYYFPDAFRILGPGEVRYPLPWDRLTKRQQRFQAAKMEVHAAMVDRIDREVGKLLRQLEHMDAMENTLILFLSDNGASAEIMVRGDGHDPAAPAGSRKTHLCLGPGWSTHCNTPFRRHKTWVHEGGIATPLIAHWPRGITDRGTWRQHIGHVVDVVPTFVELAGVKQPEPSQEHPPWHGTSFAATLRQPTSPNATRTLWWLHEGNRALRQGNWKIVAARGDPWELYDLAVDRTETRNLAQQRPEQLQQMVKRWETQWEEMKRLAGAD